MGMAELTGERKIEWLISRMNRKERRLYEKYLRKMPRIEAVLKATGEKCV